MAHLPTYLSVMAGLGWHTDRRAAEAHAARADRHYHERLRQCHDGIETRGQQQSRADGAQARSEESKMKRAAEAALVNCISPGGGLSALFALSVKTSVARNPMIALVAGGGFEPP